MMFCIEPSHHVYMRPLGKRVAKCDSICSIAQRFTCEAENALTGSPHAGYYGHFKKICVFYFKQAMKNIDEAVFMCTSFPDEAMGVDIWI